MAIDSSVLYRYIHEITANTLDSQGLVFIRNKYMKSIIGTYPIVEDPSNTFCQKYIVPSSRIDVTLNCYTNTPGMQVGNGVSILFGFRTPSSPDATNTKTMFLWDMWGLGYQGYIFYRANSKKIALRYSTTDLVVQTDYDFQPDTDYHLVFRLETTKWQIYINNVLIVSGTNSTQQDFNTSFTYNLFGSQRYTGDNMHYPSRFYYLYCYYNYPIIFNDPVEYETYLQTPGFKDLFNTSMRLMPDPIPVNTINLPFTLYDPKVFQYIFSGQVTFNNVIKYKHPSTTVVQLLDPISQTVLKATMTNDDGSFVLRYDTYPKYSQLIAIDYSGEYNTQSLLLKTTS